MLLSNYLIAICCFLLTTNLTATTCDQIKTLLKDQLSTGLETLSSQLTGLEQNLTLLAETVDEKLHGPKLTPQTIPVMPIAKFAALTNQSLASITPEAAAVISSKQLNALSQEKLASLQQTAQETIPLATIFNAQLNLSQLKGLLSHQQYLGDLTVNSLISIIDETNSISTSYIQAVSYKERQTIAENIYSLATTINRWYNKNEIKYSNALILYAALQLKTIINTFHTQYSLLPQNFSQPNNNQSIEIKTYAALKKTYNNQTIDTLPEQINKYAENFKNYIENLPRKIESLTTDQINKLNTKAITPDIASLFYLKALPKLTKNQIHDLQQAAKEVIFFEAITSLKQPQFNAFCTITEHSNELFNLILQIDNTINSRQNIKTIVDFYTLLTTGLIPLIENITKQFNENHNNILIQALLLYTTSQLIERLFENSFNQNTFSNTLNNIKKNAQKKYNLTLQNLNYTTIRNYTQYTAKLDNSSSPLNPAAYLAHISSYLQTFKQTINDEYLLSAEKIKKLSPQKFNELDRSIIATITPEAAAIITAEQLNNLDSYKIEALSPQAKAAIPFTTIINAKLKNFQLEKFDSTDNSTNSLNTNTLNLIQDYQFYIQQAHSLASQQNPPLTYSIMNNLLPILQEITHTIAKHFHEKPDTTRMAHALLFHTAYQLKMIINTLAHFPLWIDEGNDFNTVKNFLTQFNDPKFEVKNYAEFALLNTKEKDDFIKNVWQCAQQLKIHANYIKIHETKPSDIPNLTDQRITPLTGITTAAFSAEQIKAFLPQQLTLLQQSAKEGISLKTLAQAKFTNEQIQAFFAIPSNTTISFDNQSTDNLIRNIKTLENINEQVVTTINNINNTFKQSTSNNHFKAFLFYKALQILAHIYNILDVLDEPTLPGIFPEALTNAKNALLQLTLVPYDIPSYSDYIALSAQQPSGATSVNPEEYIFNIASSLTSLVQALQESLPAIALQKATSNPASLTEQDLAMLTPEALKNLAANKKELIPFATICGADLTQEQFNALVNLNETNTEIYNAYKNFKEAIAICRKIIEEINFRDYQYVVRENNTIIIIDANNPANTGEVVQQMKIENSHKKDADTIIASAEKIRKIYLQPENPAVSRYCKALLVDTIHSIAQNIKLILEKNDFNNDWYTWDTPTRGRNSLGEFHQQLYAYTPIINYNKFSLQQKSVINDMVNSFINYIHKIGMDAGEYDRKNSLHLETIEEIIEYKIDANKRAADQARQTQEAAAEVTRIDNEPFSTISEEDLAKVSETRISTCSAQEIVDLGLKFKALKPTQIQALRNQQLSAITPAQAGVMTFEQIIAIASQHIKNIDQNTRLNLSVNAFCQAIPKLNERQFIAYTNSNKTIFDACSKAEAAYNIIRDIQNQDYRRTIEEGLLDIEQAITDIKKTIDSLFGKNTLTITALVNASEKIKKCVFTLSNPEATQATWLNETKYTNLVTKKNAAEQSLNKFKSNPDKKYAFIAIDAVYNYAYEFTKLVRLKEHTSQEQTSEKIGQAFSTMSAETFAAISVEKLRDIPYSYFKSMRPDTLSKMTPEQGSCLTKEQIENITLNTLASMSAAAAEAIKNNSVVFDNLKIQQKKTILVRTSSSTAGTGSFTSH